MRAIGANPASPLGENDFSEIKLANSGHITNCLFIRRTAFGKIRAFSFNDERDLS